MRIQNKASSGAREKARASQVPEPSSSPLFRKEDWLSALATFVLMWVVYFLTLAPEVTLEDAGELITGSMYAGIPHPPGYPVWTLYSWLWTVLIPVGNMAWRVALAQANAGAVACALITLIVSRGSGLLMDSLESLRELAAKRRLVISIVAGMVAGLLMGLDAFMWRESVAANRMAVSSVPWFMLVLVCLMRWIYSGHQFRYLYWALFLFGLCFTTHQSLIVAALGIEVLIAARNPRLGRDVFFGNGVIYLVYNLVLWSTGEHIFRNIGAKSGLLLLFNLIGLGSLVASIWLAVRTRGLLSEWKPAAIMGALWLLGASFYFYLPLSGMTNPPMQWCYPRTMDGFIHAITRGQYEQPNPVNVWAEPGRFAGQLEMLVGGLGDSFTWIAVMLSLVPFIFLLKLKSRERAWLIGLSALYLCLGVLLMILLNPTPERASADLVKVFFNNSHTLIATLIGYGLALTAAWMTTHYEKFRRWGLLGGGIAALLALYSLFDSTTRHFFGPAGRIGLSELPHWIGIAFGKNQYGLPVIAHLLLLALALIFLLAIVVYRRRAPLAVALAAFAGLPLYSGMSHWFECDQRGHMFGYWFGHDMFSPPFIGKDGKPLFPQMTKDAILFGGTDPGRFCPTYMVFCESFTPHRCQPAEDQTFDRRDVYVITQNALADLPYLNYLRAHYNRSAQKDPPFVSEMFRTVLKDKEYQTNLLARASAPVDSLLSRFGASVERHRRTYTSMFAEKDFIGLTSFAAKLRPGPGRDELSRFVYESLSATTQQLVCAQQEGQLLRKCLARDLNSLLEREERHGRKMTALRCRKQALDRKLIGSGASARTLFRRESLEKELAELSANTTILFTPERFKNAQLPDYLVDFIGQNPEGNSRIRLNRLLLEAAYPNEIARSPGGLYPDREIYTPSLEDHQRVFSQYYQDAARRFQLSQLRPGEDVKVADDKLQISGTVAIMTINGMLTKLIFDKNPKNEFFVEESFPLEWMYPYLSPHGVIMKLNRQPLTSLPEDIFERDHEFWRQYTGRLTGETIGDGTSVSDVCKWVERRYLRYDLEGFTGDRKFIHDIDAQKSFAKLRTALAGVYAWRLNPQCPPEFRPKSNAEVQSLVKEADFAFMQAFSFCPWSPETVSRYVNFLLQTNRLEDALTIAETSLKFDPYDGQVRYLADNLRQYKRQITSASDTGLKQEAQPGRGSHL